MAGDDLILTKDLGLTPEEEKELQEIWADPEVKLKFMLKIKDLIDQYNLHKKNLRNIAEIKARILKME